MSGEHTSPEVASLAARLLNHPDPNVRSLAGSALTQAPDRQAPAPGFVLVPVVPKRRLDWLEQQTVKVSKPLVHGSLHLFYANPDDSFEGEVGPSDLRDRIDRQLSLTDGSVKP